MGITITLALNKIIFLCYLGEILVGGIMYSHPLFRLKDKPVIAIASVAVCFAFEAVGMWSLYSGITGETIIFAVYIFSLVFFLVFLKDFRDVKGDKNSLPVMFGVRKAALLCSVMIFFPMPLLLHFSLIPALVFLIALMPCVYILLFRDPVLLGSRLKDFMIFAIFAPNLSMFLF
jgi:1,4-dihydroxy-2-naphthoate octaprenyltransferase